MKRAQEVLVSEEDIAGFLTVNKSAEEQRPPVSL